MKMRVNVQSEVDYLRSLRRARMCALILCLRAAAISVPRDCLRLIYGPMLTRRAVSRHLYRLMISGWAELDAAYCEIDGVFDSPLLMVLRYRCTHGGLEMLDLIDLYGAENVSIRVQYMPNKMLLTRLYNHNGIHVFPGVYIHLRAADQ